MTRRTARVALTFVAGVLAAAAAARAGETPEKAAQTSATAWLAIVDSGRYGESWDAAAALFRQALSRPQWDEALRKVRSPLGKRVSRKLRGAQYTKSVPNAPPGEYVVIQYDTRFENMSAAVETVTPMKDKDGVWRVSGYYIR